MKNAKRSDREIAKKLGVSQATVSRRRAKLERKLIEGYTVIPKWEELGYEIFAITLIKIKSVAASKERYATVRRRGLEWLMSQPNIIMAGACRGMGMDSFNLSVHKSYSDYDARAHHNSQHSSSHIFIKNDCQATSSKHDVVLSKILPIARIVTNPCQNVFLSKL